MRAIEYTSQFKRDYKRERKGRYQSIVDTALYSVLEKLVADEPLETCYCDHLLGGDWKPCRECHIKPDLLLIYDVSRSDTVKLIRLGSHSELF